jgi:hypothetical protein
MTTLNPTIELHPGTALGPYKLGDFLWKVLEELRAKGGEEGTTVRWDREVSSPPVCFEGSKGWLIMSGVESMRDGGSGFTAGNTTGLPANRTAVSTSAGLYLRAS